MSETAPHHPNTPTGSNAFESKKRRVALWCGALAASMVGASFAAVPLYKLFCQTTGYGGTTKRAEQASAMVLDQTIAVRFDGNVRQLAWNFEPDEHTRTVRIGENTLAFYRATNTSKETLHGTATFNVTPESAGAYFYKVECFCFTEQTLDPGQTVEMPVSFYIDPAIVKDPDAGRLSEITLSYTFYPSENAAKKPDPTDERNAGG